MHRVISVVAAPPLIALLATLVVATACTSRDPPPVGPSSTTVVPFTPSVSTTTSTAAPPTDEPTDAPSLDVEVPDDMRTAIVDNMDLVRIDAGDLSPLVPPGAEIGFSDVRATPDDPIDQIAVTWNRPGAGFTGEWGFVVWQRPELGPWNALYAFTDQPREEIGGIREPQFADVTGDGSDEYLTFEDRGGSGACGTARVISVSAGSAREIWRRDVCDTVVGFEGASLVTRQAVFGPNDPHCCPSAFRTTTFEWNGKRLVPGEVEEEPVG